MRKILTLAVIMTASLCGSAQAYDHSMPWPDVGAHHAFKPECEGNPCADVAVSEIWIGPGHVRPFVISHEIGHIFWHQVADESDRLWFKTKLHLPANRQWYGTQSEYSAGHRIPTELAADAFAACDLRLGTRRLKHGIILHRWESGYGYAPSQRLHRSICARILQIGTTH